MLSIVNILEFIRDTSIKDLFFNFLKLAFCIITISLIITILEKLGKMSDPRVHIGTDALHIDNSKGFEVSAADITHQVLDEITTAEREVLVEYNNRFRDIEERSDRAVSELSSDSDDDVLEIIPPGDDGDNDDGVIFSNIESQTRQPVEPAKYNYSRNIFPLGPRRNYYSKPQNGYWARMGHELDNKTNTFIDVRAFDQGIPKVSCLQVQDGAEYTKFWTIMVALRDFIAKRPILPARTGINKLKVDFNVSPFGRLEILNTEFISNPTTTGDCQQHSIQFNDQETYALTKFTTLRAFQDLLFDYRLGRAVEYGGQSEGLYAESFYSYDTDKYKRERLQHIPAKVSESVSFAPELSEQQVDNLNKLVSDQVVAAAQEAVTQQLSYRSENVEN